MAIVFRCNQCQTQFQVADGSAGKSAKCKKCGTKLRVPETSEIPVAPTPASSQPAAPKPKETVIPAQVVPAQVVPAEFVEPEVVQPKLAEPDIVQAKVVQAPSSHSGKGTNLAPAVPFAEWVSFEESRFETPVEVVPLPMKKNAPLVEATVVGASNAGRGIEGGKPIARPAENGIRSLAKGVSSKGSLATSSAPQPSSKVSVDLSAHIRGKIEPIRTTTQYRIASLLVAFFMVLLPVLYVAMIGAIIAGACWHAYNDTWIMSLQTRRGALLVILYAAPIFIAFILVFFMIKPLLAPSGQQEKPISLDRKTQPNLFRFVDQLCDAVHAPQPSRIDIDCDVNASASFRHGIFSMFGNDMVLTIGLPLVSGLNVRQFSGVLAHEFGHFSQGFGMRLTYLIRSINFWFVRVVYERDAWDDWLDRSGDNWVFLLAKALVWVSRGILWCFMFVGQIVSCYMLRQMEFDADLHESRFAGSRTFESTARSLRRLGAAFHQTMEDIHVSLLEGKLGDNIPLMTQLNRDEQKSDEIEFLRKSIDDETTDLLSTHPCDHDRINAALSENASGIFQVEVSARSLFENYDDLCRNVTLRFLKETLEEEFKPSMIVPASELLAHKSQFSESSKALETLFGAEFGTMRRIVLPMIPIRPPRDANSMLQTYATTFDRLLQSVEKYKEDYQEFDQIDSDWIACYQVIGLKTLGVHVKHTDFRVPSKTLEEAQKAKREIEFRMEQQSAKLLQHEQDFAECLHLALQLLLVPDIRHLYGNNVDTDHKNALQAHRTLEGIIQLIPKICENRNLLISLTSMITSIDLNKLTSEQHQQFLIPTRLIAQSLPSLANQLRSLPLPFEHSREVNNLGDYLLPKLPEQDEVADVIEATEKLAQQFHFVFYRCIGNLSLLCVQLRAAIERAPH